MFCVYIHIPFCKKVCDYCDFRVMPSHSKLFAEYTDLLCKQIVSFESRNPGVLANAKTLYLGGGTPSELPPEYLCRIFECLRSVGIDPSNLQEVSMEFNPESTCRESVQNAMELGVNRVSIGLQTFDANLLKIVGRAHSVESGLEALNLLTSTPNLQVNADLMFDLPGQTVEGFLADVDRLSDYPLNHVSFYGLNVSPRSKLGHKVSAGALSVNEDLYEPMYKSLLDSDMLALYKEVEIPLVDVLVDMEREGVRIDVDVLTKYSADLAKERDGIEKEIYQLAGTTFNISSPKQLGEILYDKMQVTDKPPLTATKQYSTAEDVLQKLADRHPIIPLILEFRSLNKLISTYLDTFPKLIDSQSGRLHTIYNQTVTATGRLSSSNPNLQNIPIRTERGREIRRAFVPRDNEHSILAADYSQIELRIIASLSNDEHMIAAFANHYDIHAATAAKIYHLNIDEVSKEQRRNAKSVNFGIVYGISAFGLSEQLNIPRKEAAALIEEYFQQYPAIKQYIDSNIAFAREHGYAQTLLGRRRYLYDINSRNAAQRQFAERNAVNMPVQGTSADMIKIAMIRVWKKFKELNLQSKMILQVHDELVFDVLNSEIDIVKEIVEHEMVNALPLSIPVEVGIDVGQNWLEAH